MFKAVLKTDNQANHANAQFLVYEPRTFENKVPEQAVPFARSQEANAEPQKFVISGLVAETTHLQGLEQKNFQTRVQGEVLSRLKEVEEKAYAEAKALGMIEGREQALTETKGEVELQISNLKNIITELTELKARLLVQNEKHIVETIFYIAQSIALDQIKETPENISTVVSKALENAQAEESIILRLSPSDSVFLEKIIAVAGNPFEKLTHLKIEASETVSPGGVIVETNYGVIDATIEQRVKKVREAVVAKIPTPAKEEPKV